jgi:hypothetical protein
LQTKHFQTETISATNQHATVEEVLEMAFSAVVHAEELLAVRNEDLVK